jgi:hypothetical protein
MQSPWSRCSRQPVEGALEPGLDPFLTELADPVRQQFVLGVGDERPCRRIEPGFGGDDRDAPEGPLEQMRRVEPISRATAA